MRKDDVSSVYIYNKKTNKFLLIYHKKFLKWLPPGGHVNPDESSYNAAIREVKEELGIDVKLTLLTLKDNNIFTSIDYLYPPVSEEFCVVEEFIEENEYREAHFHLDHIYIALIDEDTKILINDNEIVDYKWFSVNEIQELDTFDNVKIVSRLIDSEIGGTPRYV